MDGRLDYFYLVIKDAAENVYSIEDLMFRKRFIFFAQQVVVPDLVLDICRVALTRDELSVLDPALEVA